MGKEQFVGSWKLILSEFRRSDGKVSYPMGKDIMGLIMYDPNGYVSAQMLNPDRPTFISGDHLKGTPEEIKAAFEGCMTYFGTYEIKENERMIIHNVEGSSFPNWEGQALRRYYEFSDDRLTLSTPPMKMGGETITGVLTWKRAKPVEPKQQIQPSCC